MRDAMIYFGFSLLAGLMQLPGSYGITKKCGKPDEWSFYQAYENVENEHLAEKHVITGADLYLLIFCIFILNRNPRCCSNMMFSYTISSYRQ